MPNVRIRRPGATMLVVVLSLLAGCSATSGAAAKSSQGAAAANATQGATPAGTLCGTTRTGANVPVVIKVTKGTVSCSTALRIEDDYAALIKGGDLKGNGGGAPLAVGGWTCQGYPTPQVLATGVASECHTTSAEVIAVLALPTSARPSSSPN